MASLERFEAEVRKEIEATTAAKAKAAAAAANAHTEL